MWCIRADQALRKLFFPLDIEAIFFVHDQRSLQRMSHWISILTLLKTIETQIHPHPFTQNIITRVREHLSKERYEGCLHCQFCPEHGQTPNTAFSFQHYIFLFLTLQGHCRNIRKPEGFDHKGITQNKRMVRTCALYIEYAQRIYRPAPQNITPYSRLFNTGTLGEHHYLLRDPLLLVANEGFLCIPQSTQYRQRERVLCIPPRFFRPLMIGRTMVRTTRVCYVKANTNGNVKIMSNSEVNAWNRR